MSNLKCPSDLSGDGEQADGYIQCLKSEDQMNIDRKDIRDHSYGELHLEARETRKEKPAKETKKQPVYSQTRKQYTLQAQSIILQASGHYPLTHRSLKNC